MEEVGRVFESINLAILIATDAGDVGLDSSDCMGVFQEGSFSSKTALVQKMGRIRSKLNSDASLTIFMSVALWAKLFLRIRSSDGAKGEIQRQERDLAAVLRLLLSESPLCLHQAIEDEFRDPKTEASTSGRCGSACPCCDLSLGLAASPVDRAAAERNLRVHFNCAPRSPFQHVVSCLERNFVKLKSIIAAAYLVATILSCSSVSLLHFCCLFTLHLREEPIIRLVNRIVQGFGQRQRRLLLIVELLNLCGTEEMKSGQKITLPFINVGALWLRHSVRR